MSKSPLPVIDISSFLPTTPFDHTARKACTDAIFAACTSWGFFYLTGHDIPAPLSDAILSQSREFFLGSTLMEKAAIKRKPFGVDNGDGARGWQPVKDNVTGGKRDLQEAVDFYRNGDEVEINCKKAGREPPYDILMGRNLWPNKPAELQKTGEEYIDRMLQLGEVVLRAMGTALGEENEEVFLPHTNKSFWGMRLIGYEQLLVVEGSSEEGEMDGISFGEHTDYGCVTFLITDETSGALKIKPSSSDGQSQQAWIDVDPIPGAIVVNIGDMMERWTNGLWRSSPHKVEHRGEGFRVSVPFFYEPNFDAKIVPLTTCVERTGGIAKYEETTYGEHLLGKISGNFYTGIGAIQPTADGEDQGPSSCLSCLG